MVLRQLSNTISRTEYQLGSLGWSKSILVAQIACQSRICRLVHGQASHEDLHKMTKASFRAVNECPRH